MRYCPCVSSDPQDGNYKDGATCLNCGNVIDWNNCRCVQQTPSIVIDDQGDEVPYCDKCWKVIP